jgi:hypothetical protein
VVVKNRALVITCLMVFALAGSARAQVGNRNFLDTIIVQDPNPSNDVDIIPLAYSDAQTHGFSLEVDVEKALSDNTSIQIALPYNYPSCDVELEKCAASAISRRNHRRTKRFKHGEELAAGFGNPEFLGKWSPIVSVPHEFRLGIGVNATVATGNYAAGADTHNYVGPLVMMAKGMGDLPNYGWLRFLRPLALQADGGALSKTSGATTNFAYADIGISYSFDYMHNYVRGIDMPTWVPELTPFSEFAYTGEFNVVTKKGVAPNFIALPGVALSQGAYQYSLASEFALNQGAVRFNHFVFMALLDIALDTLYPRVFGWTPF